MDYQKVAFEFFTGVDSDDDEKMNELHYAPEEMFYVRSGYVGTQRYRKGFFKSFTDNMSLFGYFR